MGDMPAQRMPTAVGKSEETALSASLNGDGLRSPSSSESTPDPEQDNEIELPDHDLDNEHDLDGHTPQQELPPQPQKRKGGRKPIYATSEERKQRNRQAQAAFRERRTEYIKQLENTIKTHEENLASLQASHRTAADECLMLRYKNSLLERILVEKGIDVQAELHAKTSPNLVPTRVPPGPGANQGIGRFPMGKYGAARRPLSISAKSDGQGENVIVQSRSPLSQATSASHLPSPIAPMARSPNFIPQQGGAISPSFGPIGQNGQHIRPQPQLRAQFNQPVRPAFAQHHPISSSQSTASGNSSLSGSSGPKDPQSQYFISPFQSHYDQLDQEYDAQANMLDEQEPDNATFSASSFAPPVPPQVQHGMPPPSPINPNLPQSQPQQPAATSGAQNGGVPSSFDPADPMLDADPFGLSASMYFPTPYSFDAQR
ncbi:hypothetical protein BT63DRAFT_274740 [Microthyrium microscopicum]|uniref:BZIP domain-containing protein n=1 Tax=Microthyrium microscopicum TaxID=703497 RepID=A0A6A6U7Z6_9PEZI|nr:hypothetical protein BT63DRAFT_274740 [Microthyrium microscopicum]